MRGAIIGNGFIAEQCHLPGYRALDDVEVVAVADVTPARLEQARRLVPGIRAYADHAALLAAERDLDFVAIATPPRDHMQIAVDTLERGIAVLCEKPLAATSGEALEMVRAARRGGAVLFPVHNYEHAPVIRRLRALLAAGEIGAPRSCTLCTFRTSHAVGTPEYCPDWRRRRELAGGGIAMDHGSHSFYLTFVFMGAYPEAVSATTFARQRQFDTEDSVTCTLRFPDGFAQVYLSWTAGARRVTYSIQGSKGAVFVDDDELVVVTGASTQRESISSGFEDASHVTWFSTLFDRFRAAVRAGDVVGREIRDAYCCVRLIEKVYESAASGSREVPLELDLSLLG